MDIKRAITHPVETFQTAPFGSLLTMLGSVASAYCITRLSQGNLSPAEIPIVSMGAPIAPVTVALGPLVINKQCQLRDRLERIVESRGFSVSAFEGTTRTYCDRQTARLVCKNSGVLPQYEELRRQRKDQSALTWLPHF